MQKVVFSLLQSLPGSSSLTPADEMLTHTAWNSCLPLDYAVGGLDPTTGVTSIAKSHRGPYIYMSPKQIPGKMPKDYAAN